MILEHLLGRPREETRTVVVSGAGIDQDATLSRVFGGKKTTAGVAVDDEAVMGIGAFLCGMRALAWGLGTLPLKTYERKPGGDKTARDDLPEYPLLHDRPNPEMTSPKWREIGQTHRIQWGRSLSYLQRDRQGQLLGIWPFHPRDTRRRRAPGGAIAYDVRRVKDEDEFPRPPFHRDVLFGEDVLDVPNFAGKAVWDLAREELSETMAAQQLGAGFYAGGSLYATALKLPAGKKVTTDEARENLRKNLERIHGFRRRIAILDDGKELDKLSIPPKEAQFLEARVWYISQIARWLDVTPQILKDYKDSPWHLLEDQRREWRESLLPHCVAWDMEITAKLFARRPGVFAEHNLDVVLQANLQQRYESYNQGLQNPLLKPNEARKLENRNSLGPAGDIVLVPKNMQVVPLTAEAHAFYRRIGLVADLDAEPTGDGSGDRGQGTGGKAQEAARSALADAYRHAVAKEVEEVRRAADHPEKFLGWLDKFYGTFFDKMHRLLEPAAETCRQLGLDVDAEAIAFGHCQGSHACLLDISGQCTADELARCVATELATWTKMRELPGPSEVRTIDQITPST